jgi:hypothetical protein
VIYVTWHQAAAYWAWAGAQLPTEAQWESAARGPDNRIFPWGNTFDGPRVNYCDTNCPLEFADNTVDDGYADKLVKRLCQSVFIQIHLDRDIEPLRFEHGLDVLHIALDTGQFRPAYVVAHPND